MHAIQQLLCFIQVYEIISFEFSISYLKLTFSLLVPGDDSLGDDIDSNSEGRGNKVATWLSNDVNALLREILVQGHVHYLGNLKMEKKILLQQTTCMIKHYRCEGSDNKLETLLDNKIDALFWKVIYMSGQSFILSTLFLGKPPRGRIPDLSTHFFHY